jgi:hypothetical protein
MTDFNQPTKGYRTFVLILLTIVYGFNFIDRQIVGILAPFIQEDLSLLAWLLLYFTQLLQYQLLG